VNTTILAAGSYLRDFGRLWSEAHSYPDKARLLRVPVAAAFVKGRSLVAVQPTESFFSLMHYCWSGSDGPRLQSSNVRLLPTPPVVSKGS